MRLGVGSEGRKVRKMVSRQREEEMVAAGRKKAMAASRAVAMMAAACMGRRGRWDGSNDKGGRGFDEGTSVVEESMARSGEWQMGWRSRKKQRRNIGEARDVVTAARDSDAVVWQWRGDGGTVMGGSDEGTVGSEGRRLRVLVGQRRVRLRL
ncbi:hypothetical protein GW17_00023745 [Ensete ventricosum]|nr:hypothetical protein GW17_00023745 [Ensete ventricosum]